MNARDVNLLLLDNPENFYIEETQDNLGIYSGENTFYKNVFQFYDKKEMLTKLELINDDEFVYILCHIDIGKDFKGYKKFQGLLSIYPKWKKNSMYVSSSPEAHKQIFDRLKQTESIYTYFSAKKEIECMTNIPTKKELFNSEIKEIQTDSNHPAIKPMHFDYAIITALYKHEFEEVEKLFENEPIDIYSGTQVYKYGTIAGKQVVAAYASKTGMIEASVIVTEMIHWFSPVYVLMPGVCGGSSDTDYCNIIVANNVFPLQNGKISDIKEEVDGNYQKVKLKYSNDDFDATLLTDSSGHQIKIVFEKNERENVGINIDHELGQIIEPKLKKIQEKINEDPFKFNIKIFYEPMACSIMVINKEDYFEDNILGIDRNTKAVEMESYGVARACQIAKGGSTKWLIFKSVMDKADKKNDDYKAKAANTSALFLKYLLEMNII